MPQLLKELSFMKRAVPVSVKAWHGMIAEGLAPQRAELIRGVIIEKMSKSILHVSILDQLMQMLRSLLGPGYWMRQEAPLTLHSSEPEPDISIVEGTRSTYTRHPTTAKLVVEIAVTTLREDREMAEIYAEAEVEEYWIVNAAARCMEVYREPRNGLYQKVETVGLEGTLSCRSLPGISLRLAEIFAGLPTVAA